MAEQVNVLLKELATATQKQTELGVRKKKADAESIEINGWINAIERNRNALINKKEKVDAESIVINDWINAIESNRNALMNKIATLTPTGTTCASASRLPPLFYMR